MEYRPLGRTGVQVSKLCLGTMMFGPWGNTDHDDSIRIIHRAVDAGINFVDTADVYSTGESEEIVGKALKARRDDIILATKVSVPMDDDPNHRGSSRRWIVAEVENSLAGGWLSGNWTADSSPTSPARQRLAARFDMSLRGRWSSSTASCPPPTSRSTASGSTASTRSSARASTSTLPTPATASRPSSPPCGAADPEGYAAHLR
jgi:hypothetical protein